MGQNQVPPYILSCSFHSESVTIGKKPTCTHTYTPAAVVVPAHEHFSSSTADGAVRLITVIVVLIRALQETVLQGNRTPPQHQSEVRTGLIDRWKCVHVYTLQLWHMAPINRGCSSDTFRLPQEIQISAHKTTSWRCLEQQDTVPYYLCCLHIIHSMHILSYDTLTYYICQNIYF